MGKAGSEFNDVSPHMEVQLLLEDLPCKSDAPVFAFPLLTLLPCLVVHYVALLDEAAEGP